MSKIASQPAVMPVHSSVSIFIQSCAPKQMVALVEKRPHKHLWDCLGMHRELTTV